MSPRLCCWDCAADRLQDQRRTSAQSAGVHPLRRLDPVAGINPDYRRRRRKKKKKIKGDTVVVVVESFNPLVLVQYSHGGHGPCDYICMYI